ncbi:hypothetical protein BGW39_003599 [Mortierella sp. 14UC]|nr:hypothetical protein BGW39_003599 [Mortierella sp. 14UC]
MLKNTPVTKTTTARANQGAAATAASILLQSMYAQGDPFKTIARHLTDIKSRIDDMDPRIHSTSECVDNSTLSHLGQPHCSDWMPQSADGSIDITASTAATIREKNNPIIPPVTSELDEMKRNIEENSQNIQTLTARLNEIAAIVMPAARAERHEDDEEDGIAWDVEDDQQRPMELEQNGNDGITDAGYKSVAERVTKGKGKSQEHCEQEDEALKEEEEGEEGMVVGCPNNQAEVNWEETDTDAGAEPAVDIAPQPQPLTNIFPEQDLCRLFDYVASLYLQPSQASVNILARRHEFSTSMPQTLDELWSIWFVSGPDRPSIWSLEALVDRWRFRASTSQNSAYYHQRAVIHNVLERLLKIERDSASTNAVVFEERVSNAKAIVQTEIDKYGTMPTYSIVQHKEKTRLRRLRGTNSR